MPFWLWLILGLALLLGEMLTPGGFFILFFGVGALVTGLVGLVGIELPVWGQWLLFTAVSVATLLLLRRRFVRGFAPPPDTPKVDPLVGEEAVALEAIVPGRLGKVELRGTPWNARLTAARPLASGDRVRVERVEGLTVYVAPLD
ncbi:MAG: NfeD family protein [Thermoanaerobaculia bacterium]|nr:NfeD family protein [Thermoanaerobaculia bacterium]MCZ7650090.1 NfeD family protein [Thermoanaerobaculia bacterium]